jgi:hypothetical protein
MLPKLFISDIRACCCAAGHHFNVNETPEQHVHKFQLVMSKSKKRKRQTNVVMTDASTNLGVI